VASTSAFASGRVEGHSRRGALPLGKFPEASPLQVDWGTQDCGAQHAVDLFFGLQGESPENGSFLGFGWRLLAVLGQKGSNIGLRRLLAMRKAHVWWAFFIQRRKFSETRTAWLTWEDSNLHIPD
jgi:hypothetical protein